MLRRQSILGVAENERCRVRGLVEVGGGLGVGCGFSVLVVGFLGLPCNEGGEKGGSGY